MSDTETPIMLTPDRIYASGNSLVHYRQAFTSLHVFDLKDGGRRVEINDDGRIIIFDLSHEQALTLANLLSSEPERTP